MEMDEKWQTGHKYLDMAEYLAWKRGVSEAVETAATIHRIR
jgi:hypothetical protein